MTALLSETPVIEPTDLLEARDAVRDTPGSLLLRGAGTKLAWGMPAERTDAVVSTRHLDGLVDHSPGDMVAVVGAGMPLARLQGALAEHRQWLAIDPPRADATVGGVFVAADAGPRRHRYGTMRDLVIGVTFVLADGTVGRAGGRVVKNVAGFDLMRLLCGSLGTLGLVTDLTVRLHPLPESSATARVAAGAPTARRIATAVADIADPLVSACQWREGSLCIRLEGRQAAVEGALSGVQRTAADHGGADVAVLAGDAEQDVWAALADVAAGAPDHTVARAACSPDRFPPVEAALRRAGEQAGVQADLVSDPLLGLHTASLAGARAAAHAAVVGQWRRAVAELGGTVVVRDHASGVLDEVDAWLDPSAPPPSALPLMRRVKQALDPDRRLAPGRYLGGM